MADLRVLVCGSRTFDDPSIVRVVLDGLWGEYTIGFLTVDMNGMVVIEGACPTGADEYARWWAESSPMHSHGENPDHPPFQHLRFPAKWDLHGKSAGPIRNQQMLDEGQPNLVIAFVDKPLEESRGTADMVGRARKAGVDCYVVQKMSTGPLEG